jgi:putative Holliday junction resolvase
VREKRERVLGLDFGEKRIGLAISDPLGATAQPLEVIDRQSLADDIDRIGEMAARRDTSKIVVGLPLNMDGSVGPQARRVRRFAARLRRELELEVVLWDERLSSAEAERALLHADERRSRRSEVRDAVAAAVVLQAYLDAQRRSVQE